MPRLVSECITCTSCSAKRHLCLRFHADPVDDPDDRLASSDARRTPAAVAARGARVSASEGITSRKDVARRRARWRVRSTALRLIVPRRRKVRGHATRSNGVVLFATFIRKCGADLATTPAMKLSALIESRGVSPVAVRLHRDHGRSARAGARGGIRARVMGRGERHPGGIGERANLRRGRADADARAGRVGRDEGAPWGLSLAPS